MNTLRILPLALLLVACGGASHDEAADRTLASIKDFAKILGSVKDKASAETAKKDLAALSKRLDGINADLDKLGKPSEEKAKEIAERIQKGLDGMDDEMQKTSATLGSMPEVAMSLQKEVTAVANKLAQIKEKLGG